jgi:hypothetical protein
MKITTTDKAAQVADLRLRADNCICVVQLEMRRAKPCFDLAFDFAEKALMAIGNLRILDAAATRTGRTAS